MRKIIILLISVFFLTSCGRQSTTETITDVKDHYTKAKEYYIKYKLGNVDLHNTDKALNRQLELYKKTLSELDLAVFETTGDSREEVMNMIDDCNYNVELIQERLELRERNRRESGTQSRNEPRHSWGIGSDLNKAIHDSRAEIERKRNEIYNSRE